MSRLMMVSICCGLLVLVAGAINTTQAQDAGGAPGQAGGIGAPDAQGVIPSLVHRGDVTEFLKLLGVACQKNIVPSPKVIGPVNVNLFDVTWHEALDAVLRVNGFAYMEEGPFIYVYTQKEYDQIMDDQRRVESRTFHFDYISAIDVEELVKSLLSDNGKLTSTPEATTGSQGGGEDWAGSSCIVVVDYPERLDEIAKVVQDMDRRPKQVLVEATILVASLDDDNQFGIDFSMVGDTAFALGADGAISGTAADSSAETEVAGWTSVAAGVGSGGLTIGITSNNVGLFIRALESVTDVVALGNPKILTLNRQSGKMIVGNEDGYITTEVSQTSTTQKVEFLQTGTTLEFRPFVMSDGYIRMELKPEDSDGGVGVLSGFLVPSKTTAEVSTNVLVKDGHTIVIGGLFRDRTELIRSQVPLMGNIPIVGNLFRSTLDNNTREEVIFLVTPHIVDEPVDYAAADEVLESSNRRMYAMREGMQWHARNRLAEGHYDSAVRRHLSGDFKGALCQANLAAHVSPGFLEAVQLRDELRGKDTYWGETGSMRLFMRRLIEQDGFVEDAIEPGAQVDVAEPETSVSAEQVDEPVAVEDAEDKETQGPVETVDENAEITAMVIEATSSQ